MSTNGFLAHDHADCISTGVSRAESYCANNKLKLTPARKRVLEILLEEHRAMGAYEILDILRDEGLGSQPPVAYRALDFLVKHGFAHRVEQLNAFVACTHPEDDHTPVFLICKKCKSVAELTTDLSAGRIHEAARATNFAVDHIVVEARGTCPNCPEAAE